MVVQEGLCGYGGCYEAQVGMSVRQRHLVFSTHFITRPLAKEETDDMDKTPQMVLNPSGKGYRYYADPAAHLAYQTMYTREGRINMLNRKPPKKSKKK